MKEKSQKSKFSIQTQYNKCD